MTRLKPIDGLMPDPSNLPVGCAFCDRCPYKIPQCDAAHPQAIEIEPGHLVRCHLFGKEVRQNG